MKPKMLAPLNWSPKLSMWKSEALLEAGIELPQNKNYALFPLKWVNKILSLHQYKSVDYNFIGSYAIDRVTQRNREWVIDFAKYQFTSNSYLKLTDMKTRETHTRLGIFDKTHTGTGFVPKEAPIGDRNFFDTNYYRIMCKSKFTLCPNGDSLWSMRFYEAIACMSIPILPDSDSFRSKLEERIGYHFFLPEDPHIFSDEIAEENFMKFLDNHTLGSL